MVQVCMVYTTILQTTIGFVLPACFFLCYDSRWVSPTALPKVSWWKAHTRRVAWQAHLGARCALRILVVEKAGQPATTRAFPAHVQVGHEICRGA